MALRGMSAPSARRFATLGGLLLLGLAGVFRQAPGGLRGPHWEETPRFARPTTVDLRGVLGNDDALARLATRKNVEGVDLFAAAVTEGWPTCPGSPGCGRSTWG